MDSIPVPNFPTAFFNRTKALRRIVQRILTGQSVAIIGDPRIGKTTLLRYLMDPANSPALYGNKAGGLIFNILSTQAFHLGFTQADFWELALEPLARRLEQEDPDSPLVKTYAICRSNNFGTFVLQQLLVKMQQAGLHLVLLVDEFDNLLDCPSLNRPEFYGGLRMLASFCNQSLTLVIANRLPLSELHEKTREYSRSGSPYFNFMDEIVIGPFSEKEADDYLTQSSSNFRASERHALYDLTGGHPDLLRVASITLNEAYLDGLRTNARLEKTSLEVIRAAANILNDAWDLWPSEAQKALCVITLCEAPQMLGHHKFRLEALIHSLKDYQTELRFLQERGYIVMNDTFLSGYCVTGKVILVWMAETLTTTLRSPDKLAAWLHHNELEGRFTTGEKEQFAKAVSNLNRVLKGNAELLVRAAIEGWTNSVYK